MKEKPRGVTNQNFGHDVTYDNAFEAKGEQFRLKKQNEDSRIGLRTVTASVV